MAKLKKSQQSLKNWTAQDWGNVSGKKGDRYLPKSVRDSLTPAQKAAENRKKREATRKGKPSAKYTKELARKVRNAESGMMVPADMSRLKKRDVNSKLVKRFDNGGKPPMQPPRPKIGPKKNEFGATNYPGGPDNPFVDEMSVFEKSVNQRALESINTIDGLFPGAKEMLIETAIIESKIGKDNRAGNNYMQLTKTGIEGITDFDSHPGLKNYYNKFKKATGIDATKATEEEWKNDPLLQAFGARLMYGKVPEAIPKTMEERAAYWDKYYNSTADEEGDAASYIKQVTEYQNK